MENINNVGFYLIIRDNVKYLMVREDISSNRALASKIPDISSAGTIDRLMSAKEDRYNNVTVDTLIAIANFFKVHPGDLMFENGAKIKKEGGATSEIMKFSLQATDEGKKQIMEFAKFASRRASNEEDD